MKRSDKSNSVAKIPSEDVFNVVYSWPFYLLDSVRAANIRNQLNTAQYVVTKLVNGKKVETYSMLPAIDGLKEVVSWIVTYQNAEVALKDMDSVKKELQEILTTLENVYRKLVIEEQDNIYGYGVKSEDEPGNEELHS